MNGQVAKRTAGAGPASAGSRTAASLVGLRWGQDEKRRLAVHLRGPFAAQFPYADASMPVVQPDAEDAHDLAFGFQRSPSRQITPPVDLHLWHLVGQVRLSRQRPAQAKSVQRSSEPPSKGEMAAAVDDGHRAGAVHLGRRLRAPDRHVARIASLGVV